jgi:hypothetical protein
MLVHECQGAIDAPGQKWSLLRSAHHDLRRLLPLRLALTREPTAWTCLWEWRAGTVFHGWLIERKFNGPVVS